MAAKKKVHSSKWTDEETLKFLKCLAVFGTDFEMMKEFFPKRNREQVKHKYRREMRADPEKVEQWMNDKSYTMARLAEEYSPEVSSVKKRFRLDSALVAAAVEEEVVE